MDKEAGLIEYNENFQKDWISHSQWGFSVCMTKGYKKIAKMIAEKNGLAKMSAQAVGGAVGWNPIGIIVPCHRVIGANNKLTGYNGGIENKIALLRLEGIDV